MDKDKPKLRLRKSLLISLPIIVLVAILSTILIVNRNKLFDNNVIETEKPEQTGFNEEYTSFKLSDSEYFKAFGKLIEDRQRDNTIISYAEKFNLDIDKTLEIAHNLTNNYEDEYFLKNNVIVPKKYQGKVATYSSFEAGVIYFVRDLSKNPSKYGATSKIVTSNKVTLVNFKYGKPLYMSNGLTFEQYYGKIADLFGVDKSTALAMAYHESGYPTRGTSGLFKKQNNIGGMKCGSNCWATYPTMEAGIIAHVLTIKSISEKNGFDIKTLDGLYKFSGIYVTGNINKPSELWTSRVLYFKNQIDSKDLFTIK